MSPGAAGIAHGRRCLLSLARAMFFTNNYIENSTVVSRETLPIICAIKKVLVNCLKSVHIMPVY